MKKALTLILALLLTFAMVACNSNNTTAGDNDDDEKESGKKTEEKVTITDPTQVTIASVVIYDANDIKITVDSIEFTVGYGEVIKPFLNFTVVNNTDMEIYICHDSELGIKVNDKSVDGVLYIGHIAAGTTATGTMDMETYSYEASGISIVESIEFGVSIYNEAGLEYLYGTEPIVIKTNAAN